MRATLARVTEVLLIPPALLAQGFAVNTPMLLKDFPVYQRVFSRLWERHKNPVSWVCRPFFGLIIGYGAILHNWPLILIGIIGVGTSWFWFPKPSCTPAWAELFIDKEFEVLTPASRWDFKKVIAPSLLPLALAGFYSLLWFLPYPWNWVGISKMIVLTALKMAWSARLESSVSRPLTRIVLLGFALGTAVGVFLFMCA